MDTSPTLHFSPFSLIGLVLKKVQVDQANLILITPVWQTQAWYPKVLQMSIRRPILIPNCQKLLVNPMGEEHPLVLNKSLKLVAWTVSGVDWKVREFRKTLPLITAARRRGTYAHYETYWRKWTSWCATKQIVDPFGCSVNFILDFLAHAFREGFQYSTIAGYRSAISANHDPIDNEPDAKHHRVSALLAGIHNERFPQPKNNFIWNVKVVEKFLASISEE